MKLTVRDMDISTGDLHVVILNSTDATELDLHPQDRLIIKKGNRKTIAVLDIAESKKAVPPGKIGFFEEVLKALKVKNGDTVSIDIAEKPRSVAFIKKKLDGKRLNAKELHAIIQDIVDNKLTDVELTTFVISGYTHGMSMREVADLTKAMAATGDTLKFKQYPVVDLHSIGGVPGNRTTMLIVPILVAAGAIMPKTSSRAITSPAGTADTMEVLCDVSLNIKKIKKIVADVGGFISWGGAVNLAPADDKIIRIEHPLSIDAEGQMLASIMSKKASVGSSHLMLEIPCGYGAKVSNRKEAKHLKRHFAQLGNMLKIKVKTVITDGSQPIGNGIGPVLEARDVIWALRCHDNAPQDLVKKSLWMAGDLLEFVGKAKKGKGRAMARQLLQSGAALEAFTKMVEAQDGKIIEPRLLKPAKRTHVHRAQKSGKVSCIQNNVIAKVARLAGAPKDKDAGIFLYKHLGDKVKKGDPIFTVYARSAHKMENAKNALRKMICVIIK